MDRHTLEEGYGNGNESGRMPEGADLMGWAVVLLPDGRGDVSARRIWRAVADGGFRSMHFEGDNRPHLSLTVLETQDGTLEGIVSRVVSELQPVTVTFASVCAFGEDVIYLAPEPTSALHAMNRAVTNALGPLRSLVDTRYLPGEWQPHMTVAFKIPEGDFSGVMRLVRASFVPFTATLGSIAVVKFHPVKIVQVFNIPFSPPAE